jgi:putative transposase
MAADSPAMGRKPRIEVVGATYHVFARGNEQRTIFTDERDYSWFLQRLGETVVENRWRCLSYCLMPNHYHLIVELTECNLGRGMQKLNLGYVRRFNWRHERVGHLFQGPYKALALEHDSHFHETFRYVALNPVKAGLVADPSSWPWSSYRATVGEAEAPAWLDVGRVAEIFGGGLREFVEAGTWFEPGPSR